MKYYFILGLYVSIGVSMACSSNKNLKDDNISIRLLPCEYLDNGKGKKPTLLRLYAVTTYKDTADKQLIRQIDSFLCRAKDSIKLVDYSGVVIRFLKETELT